MEKINERPVCHRAEDLVTHLYGEASAEEARDFATHMQQCDACRVEFSLFNQVHESMVAWRSEVLGSVPVRQADFAPVAKPTLVIQRARKLSALAALREFFTVSPVWLRGAAAFAGLLLCVLLVFAALRLSQKPAPPVNSGNEAKRSQQEFDNAVQAEVDNRMAQLAQRHVDNINRTAASEPNIKKPRPQVAVNRIRSNNQRTRLTAEEREQLAADLGLTSGRDEELPFVLPDQPNP
jgi:anti-sigma factor RsiW